MFIQITSTGSAVAFLDVGTTSGPVLRDFKLMRAAGGRLWLAAPSPRATDRDGNAVINDRGKPIYKNFADFKDRATRDRFTEEVLVLIRHEHPDIVGDA